MYREFLNCYHKMHARCPSCLSGNIEQTCVGYFPNLNDLGSYRDGNSANCECGWSGIVHDLVPVWSKPERFVPSFSYVKIDESEDFGGVSSGVIAQLLRGYPVVEGRSSSAVYAMRRQAERQILGRFTLKSETRMEERGW